MSAARHALLLAIPVSPSPDIEAVEGIFGVIHVMRLTPTLTLIRIFLLKPHERSHWIRMLLTSDCWKNEPNPVS